MVQLFRYLTGNSFGSAGLSVLFMCFHVVFVLDRGYAFGVAGMYSSYGIAQSTLVFIVAFFIIHESQ